MKHESGTLAAPTRRGALLRRLREIDAQVEALAARLQAAEVRYPTLIRTETIERAGVHTAFPHLLLGACAVRGGGEHPWHPAEPDHWQSSGWCLSPAVCYHVYEELRGHTLEQPRLVSTRGRCFRHEDRVEPGLRHIEFDMREIVLVGPREWVEDHLGMVRSALDDLVRSWGVEGTWEVATDPFFLPGSEGKALLQRLEETKLELVHRGTATALASVNRHRSFFGERFDIRDPAGQPVHTACVALGLDRWLTVLGRAEGLISDRRRPASTPASMVEAFVRRTLPGAPASGWNETLLADLALDSLDYVDMFCALHDELGVDLTTADMGSLVTLDDLVALITARLREEKDQ